MEFHISLVGRKNLTGEIFEQIRRAIVDGVLDHGAALPPTRTLAQTLDVSRSTVTVAYDRLVGEGYATSRVGAGTFVSFDGKRLDKTISDAPGALQARPVWDEIRIPSRPRPIQPYFFRTGLSDTSLFPLTLWRRLVSRELRNTANNIGIYGQAGGHIGLRTAVTRHVALSRGVVTTPDDVTITNGTQQALDIVARVLLQPGDTVAVEDPGYQPPNRLFRSLGLNVTGVPVDGEGIVAQELPDEARLVFVTPSHQYPLGVTMSMSRRQELLSWAERHNAAIIEDDYDSEFRFDGRPLETLRSLDPSGRVIYVGSFSKTVLPGLRLGFIVAPSAIRDAIHKAKQVSDWHSNTLTQVTLARMIDEGEFARHLRRISKIYRERHALVQRILKRDFATAFSVIPSVAGLHIAATAKNATSRQMDELRRRASDKGVGIHSMSEFNVAAPPTAGIVLGYGAIATDDIEGGLRRLQSCM